METTRISEARNGQMHKPKGRPGYPKTRRRILLVGEGDFSFSSSWATELGAATNMVATSLDSRGELLKKYGSVAEVNTLNLSQCGALVLHGFDACKMAMPEQRHRLGGFQSSFFHRIIYNFPHAGFSGRETDARVIKKHAKLVRLFLANARDMLSPGGRVHVSHKLGHPYVDWKIEDQARVSGLELVNRVFFFQEHYPGYHNCLGDGPRAGESFKLGPAQTFKFAARIEEPPARTLNVGEPLSISMLAHPNPLKEKAVRKARVKDVTFVQQVVADDEVFGLENLQLGKKKKVKILETPKPALHQTNSSNYQGPLEALAEDLGGSLHSKSIEMHMASVGNSANVKCRSQNIGGTESTLPPFSPQTKLEDVDRLVSHVTNSKHKYPYLKIQFVHPLRRDVSYAAVDQHVNSALNVGMSSTTLARLEVKAIRKAHASQVTPLPAAEVAHLPKLKEAEKFGKKKAQSSGLEESSSLNEEFVGCLTMLSMLWEVLWRHCQTL